MYKIFVNECPLIIATADEYQQMHTSDFMRVECNKEEFAQVLEWMFRGPSKGFITITANPDKAFDILKDVCKPIDAAGGVVFNDSGHLLMINRMGYWDLPKGKVDPGETFDFTAIREVKEECGVKEIKLGEPVARTYHLYNQYPHKMLKTCHWYLMTCPDGVVPKPQAEEHITEAIWKDMAGVDLDSLHTYETIRGLLKTVFAEKDKIEL